MSLPSLRAENWSWNSPDDQESLLYGSYAVVEVGIESIVEDPSLDPRGGLDPRRVDRRYDQFLNGAVFPPIRAVLLPNGQLVLADGWARLAVARRYAEEQGTPGTIVARIVRGTRDDARTLGIMLNEQNGDPLQPLDRQRAAEAVLQQPELAKLTLAELSRRTGLNRRILSGVRASMYPDLTEQVVNRNGQTYVQRIPQFPAVAREAATPRRPDDDLDAEMLASTTAPESVRSAPVPDSPRGDMRGGRSDVGGIRDPRPSPQRPRVSNTTTAFTITVYRDRPGQPVETGTYQLADLPLSLRLTLREQLDALDGETAYGSDAA